MFFKVHTNTLPFFITWVIRPQKIVTFISHSFIVIWFLAKCLPSAALMRLGNFQRSKVFCVIASHSEVSFDNFN